MKKLNIVILSLVSCFLSENSLANLAWHMSSKDVTNLHSFPAEHRIQYGVQSNEFVELRLPKGDGPYPVAILIHGGCWNSNFADHNNLSPLADALRDNGIATWNIEYQSLATLKNNNWKRMFLDISAGADLLTTYAKKYNLDINKVIVIGHSAGGHLALWLAGRKNLPLRSNLYPKTPLKLLGVLSLGGVPDLEQFRSDGVKTCGSDMIKLMGGQPGSKINFNEISPIRMLPLKIPQILITSKDDTSVSPMNAETYVHVARKKGDDVKLIILKNVGHHEYVAPQSLAWPTILHESKKLLHI